MLSPYAGIRLHQIFVFDNGHHVMLGKHCATISCRVLVRGLATLQV